MLTCLLYTSTGPLKVHEHTFSFNSSKFPLARVESVHLAIIVFLFTWYRAKTTLADILADLSVLEKEERLFIDTNLLQTLL